VPLPSEPAAHSRTMAAIDKSLDDIIKGGSGGVRRGGRPAATRARATTKPYSRGDGQAVQRGGRPQARRPAGGGSAEPGETLKVGSGTVPNKLAGAICNVVRESAGALAVGVMATGPASINQAIKGIAIARKYMLEESVDIVVKPQFEEDLRSGSNVVFKIFKASRPVNREPAEDDLSAKDKTDCFKLAGAVAGRIRDGAQVAVTTKGAVPVLVAIKAIALAQDYVQEEGIDLKFAVQFRDLENTDRGMDSIPSTYLHFAILPRS